MQAALLHDARTKGVPPVPQHSTLVGQFTRSTWYNGDEIRRAKWATADRATAQRRNAKYGDLSEPDFEAAAAGLRQPHAHNNGYHSHGKRLARSGRTVTLTMRCVICGEFKEVLNRNFGPQAEGEDRFHSSLRRPCRQCSETSHHCRAYTAVSSLKHASFNEFDAFPVHASAIYLTAAERFIISLTLSQGGRIVWVKPEHLPDGETTLHQVAAARCGVFGANVMTFDEDQFGQSVDNTKLTGGSEMCDHEAKRCHLVIRAIQATQGKERPNGFPNLKDAVAATVAQALHEISTYDASPTEFDERTAANTKRLLADDSWVKGVDKLVNAHKTADRKAFRDNDLTKDGYLRSLQDQGARCAVSWVLFGQRERECSMDRINDLRGHIIAVPPPGNVQFVLRIFNNRIKLGRTQFLQLLSVQDLQKPTPLQRALMETELERRTAQLLS